MSAVRTMKEAIASANQDGFTENFIVEGGMLRSVDTDQRFQPEDTLIISHERFEGPSSQDDEETLYCIETVTGERGLLVDAYGTYADEAVAEYLHRAPAREPTS